MSVLLEARPYRPFKSSEEYLIAMKEDLAEWLNALYPELRMSLDNFMDRLDTGVALCKHANNVRKSASEYVARRQARKIMTRSITSSLAMPMSQLSDVALLPNAKAGTFFARDNVSNFISWCRNSLGIIECLLFETDDLIMRKNERHVILCLLEVARRGAKFGMLAPMLVQMERQIDREIAADNKANSATNDSGNCGNNGHGDDEDADDEDEYADMNQEEPCLIYGPQPQIVTNDLKSLDEMVRELVERCTCPTQFPMIRVSEGKYRIGDTKVLIFVRILRSHVMVRVGGGWDTLSHYLDKHDPCRCRTSHRSTISAKLIQKAGGSFDLGSAQVHYERSPPRTRRSSASSVGSCGGGTSQQSNQQQPQPQQQQQPHQQSQQLQAPRSSSATGNRSRSPTPHQSNRQLGHELKKTDNRSPSPTAQSKFPSSPVRRQLSDLGNAQRSRSPITKTDSNVAGSVKTSGSPVPNGKPLNEEIHQIKDDGPSQMNHNRHNDDYQDPKNDNHREIRERLPLSEEFAKRYVVEGGVARRAYDREDAPRYEPTIYGYKCGGNGETGTISMVGTSSIKEEQRNLGDETFVKEGSRQYGKSGHADGEHSDNGSEVSDEGYRSLGAVQSAITSTNVNQHHHEASNGIVDSHDDSSSKPKIVTTESTTTGSCVETESIETGLRKTRTTVGGGSGSGNGNGGGTSSPTCSLSPVGSTGVRSSGSGSRSASAGSNNSHGQAPGERVTRVSVTGNGDRYVRETSNLSRCSSGSRTPRDENSSPDGSPCKRSSIERGSMRKPPSTSAVSPNRGNNATSTTISRQNCGHDDFTSRPEKRSTTSNATASNTWNGRQTKSRPSLTVETFARTTPSSATTKQCSSVKSSSPTTGFTRKNPTRQSLPRSSSTMCGNSVVNHNSTLTSSNYDKNGRRTKSATSKSSSSQNSPTKIVNPLLERIIHKMAHLRDDREVVEKLQGMIRDYRGSIVDVDADPDDVDGDSTMEFTRAWIDGNGTVAALPQEVQLAASPRKDPKPPSERGPGFSRIPAPIYKRPMSVASDSL